MDSTKFSPSGHPSADEKRLKELRPLEERLAHDLLDDEERQELRDCVLLSRRRRRAAGVPDPERTWLEAAADLLGSGLSFGVSRPFN